MSADLKRQMASWRSNVSRTEERSCICPANVLYGDCRQIICPFTLSGRLFSNLSKMVIFVLSTGVVAVHETGVSSSVCGEVRA